MSLTSMTGFARSDGVHTGVRWHWEIKTVNGKGLDIRTRVPPGFEGLEQAVRGAVARYVRRGNCQIALQVVQEEGATQLVVNDAVLDQVVSAAKAISERIDLAPPSADGLLAIKGVLELSKPDYEENSELNDSIIAGLEDTLQDLADNRRGEGNRLETLLVGQLAEIERLTQQARDCPARSIDAIRMRLSGQIAVLLEESASFDPDRLHQEALLLSTKADIQEELDRLDTHIAAARDLFKESGPVGRKLDFLAQEFNRETNTVCSKSNDSSLTAIGLGLKSVIDQMKEQVQNIE